MPKLAATSTHFIKLGRGGEWEADAIQSRVIRFGYLELAHDLCVNGDWDGASEA